MEYIQRVRKSDLARNTRHVIREVQRGQTAVIESHGHPEVAIMDIIDYYLQRAAINYYTRAPQVSADGLERETIKALSTEEDRYHMALAYYLAGSISLSKTAELLDLTWLDLRSRLLRLGLPIRTGPEDPEELHQELATFQDREND